MTIRSHVPKTTRILLSEGTVYVSRQIASEIRSVCVRLENNKLCPMKGHNTEVQARLAELGKKYPDHFFKSGLDFLGVRHGS